MQTIKRVIQSGGEGVILRQPKSIYESGRSDKLLKLKVVLLCCFCFLFCSFVYVFISFLLDLFFYYFILFMII